MRFFVSILLVLSIFSVASGEIRLEVIYPKPDQQLPEIDSTFVFGNVLGSTDLTINGIQVKVHRDGGWLAYLPISTGQFIFHVVAFAGNDTSSIDLPVQVGLSGTEDVSIRPLIPSAVLPENEMIYSVGEVFEFSFEAPPGGVGWFRVDSGDSAIMLEAPPIEPIYWGEVFGPSSFESPEPKDYVRYTGSYRFTAADTGRHMIYYRYRYPINSQSEYNPLRNRYLNTDTILTVIPEFPALVGVLSGRSQIVRTGPQLGYKLLYQPAGIKVRITGSKDDFYRLYLADGITGFVNIDSVTILPEGTPVPKGRVSFISVDSFERAVVISAHTGEKLPYEIHETISPAGLDIDIYGVTGDVDWIRYNDSREFDGIVKWSQPANGIFRISVSFNKGEIAGYKPYYDGNRFVIEIAKKKRSGGWFRNPFKNLRVAIDPGHSHDTGAIGPTGFEEQDANLWIAHELRLMLEDAGAEVLMTRYGHENIPLYNRPTMAEKWGADILISIHNNALPDGINPFENNGTSVYYYHPQSKALAEAIHKNLVKATGLPDHGLYYGNLVLTRPTEMPSVLVECAFMMIPEQEAMLKTDKFQRKCAKAIMKGIKEYLSK